MSTIGPSYIRRDEEESSTTPVGPVYKLKVYEGDVYKGDVYKGDVYKGDVHKGESSNGTSNDSLWAGVAEN